METETRNLTPYQDAILKQANAKIESKAYFELLIAIGICCVILYMLSSTVSAYAIICMIIANCIYSYAKFRYHHSRAYQMWKEMNNLE